MKRSIFDYWRVIVLVLLICGVLGLALSGYLSPITDIGLEKIVKIQRTIVSQIQNIRDFFTMPTDVTQLREENASLMNEVEQLKIQVVQLEQDLDEADVLYALLGFARGRPDERLLPANIIGIDPSPFLQYVLIDIGSDDGVMYNMPVITANGLVGRIQAVTSSASRVQLITDVNSTVNVIIKEDMIKEDKIEGVVRGSVTGDITIEMVSADADLHSGQLIETSGLGGNYPADIDVGQVLTVNESSATFRSASIQPVEDFKSLQAVLVVLDFRSANIDPLVE